MTFRLHSNARWHDGKPVTPEDVVWTFEMLKLHNPGQAFYYRHIVKVEKTGEREITFTADAPGNRELPSIVGQLNVLPKHWWTGTDANGKPRDITAATLETPLGNAAYRIKTVIPGRTIAYERVPDYWGKDLPVNIGKDNFDEIRWEYYRDDTVELEAFKADHYDFRIESSGKNWMSAYDFPARRDGRVILEKFTERARGVMQGFIFNLRRDKFKDPRVRLAFNYAFDFEELNRTLSSGEYERINSYFSGTELASEGLPSGKELEILKTVRGQVPAEVFTKPYVNPKGGSDEARRANLREATRLLREAGYEIRDRKLVNTKTGVPFTVEFLLSSPSFERAILFYKPALDRLGIEIDDPHRRLLAISEPHARPRIRCHRRAVAAIALARQRAARLLWLAVGRPRRRAQLRRHQESGGRRVDRARDLRQGSRRTGRRLQGARPRAFVEPLRRSALHHRLYARRSLGPVRQTGKAAGLFLRLP